MVVLSDITEEFGLGSGSPYVKLSSLVRAKVCGCYSTSFPCPTYSTKYVYILNYVTMIIL